MAFFIDTLTNRIVVVPQNVGGQPSLKVIDGETAAACHLSDGQTLTPEQVRALLDGSSGAFRATLSSAERSKMDTSRAVSVEFAPRAMTRRRA